jgi:cytochrome P450
MTGVNHDETVFPDPERFYITLIAHGHSHLGFSHGIHFCLGAPLARLEASFVLNNPWEATRYRIGR